MNRRIVIILKITALGGLAVAVPSSNALAQEMQHVSYKVGAEKSKYTQQQFIDVGDIAGHQVWSFEIHRTFPGDAPLSTE